MKMRRMLKKSLLWLVGLLFVGGVLGTAAVAMLFYWASRDLPDLNRLAEYQQPQAVDSQVIADIARWILAHEGAG